MSDQPTNDDALRALVVLVKADDEQTPEERRIRAQFQANRNSYARRTIGMGPYYLQLARQWKRPVWEIRRIVKGHHIETGEI